jgi:hypothetical protein
MNKKVLLYIVAAAGLLIVVAAMPASAGGPVCPPPYCGPPPVCAPPVCGPPPMCPPPMCAPRCRENGLSLILRGCCKLVVGVIALPFKVVDCLVSGPICPPKCRPRPRLACGPPPFCPPVGMCPPWQPMPRFCPPAYGCGMAPGMPVGFGHGAPRGFAPMVKKNSVPAKLLAGSMDGIFGTYW